MEAGRIPEPATNSQTPARSSSARAAIGSWRSWLDVALIAFALTYAIGRFGVPD